MLEIITHESCRYIHEAYNMLTHRPATIAVKLHTPMGLYGAYAIVPRIEKKRKVNKVINRLKKSLHKVTEGVPLEASFTLKRY